MLMTVIDAVVRVRSSVITLEINKMHSPKLNAILIGAIATSSLVSFAGITPIVAAATVALTSAVFVGVWRLKAASEYLPLLYMGTFVGMSNLKSMSIPLALVTLIVASFGAFVLAQLLAKRLIGVGGKLGMIAFAAGVPVMLAQGLSLSDQAIQIDTGSIALMATFTLLVLMLSIFMRKTVASPVGISALISLLGALTPYPAIIMSASFAGMSADQRLSGWRLAAVAIVFTCVFSLAFGMIAGVGGWLGLLACVSVYIVVLAERVILMIRSALPEVEEVA